MAVVAAVLLATGAIIVPLGTVPPAVASSYSYSCDGNLRTVIMDVASDVTYNPFWIKEVISYFTAVPLYPCAATAAPNGTNWGKSYDIPFIDAANLQQFSASGGLIQIGEGQCVSDSHLNCGAYGWTSGAPMLVVSSNDTSENYVPASWYAGRVLDLGHTYEVVVAVHSSTLWEYEVRDITAGDAWTVHYITKTWITPGGNRAWWGPEANNWESALSTDLYHDLDLHEMKYRGTNNTWYYDAYEDGTCPVDAPEGYPWYYSCVISGGHTLQAWTNAH